jgi:hypothetical protein
LFEQDDSSGSISDIARMVVSEMETNPPRTPPEEEHSDNDSDTEKEEEKGDNYDTPKSNDSDPGDTPISFTANA